MNGPASAASLNELDHVPADLLKLEAHELLDYLGGPTLFRLGPAAPAPTAHASSTAPHGAVFVSALLHGNETSGWDALRHLIAARGTPTRQRTLIFLGNLAAAAAGVRTLPEQPDHNRIWSSDVDPLAAALRAAIEPERFRAAIDLHNNTGKNPPFAVVTSTAPATLALAAEFAPRVVLVESPASVLTRVFDVQCPSIAVELGPVGDPRCVERAEHLLTRCLYEPRQAPLNDAPATVYRAVARIFVNPGTRFSIGESASADRVDLALGHVEAHNFATLEPGFALATTKSAIADVLTVEATDGTDVTARYLERDGAAVRLRERVIPAMSTADVRGVELDCFCYLMERLEH